MFEEGQHYSPVTAADDGSVTVHLSPTHPGAEDAAYLRRRGEIASAALAWDGHGPAPEIAYTEAEQDVWRRVSRELYARHAHLACSPYLEAWEAIGLPLARIPQLEEASERVSALTGFRFVPAPGLVPLREFYGALADGVLHCTQYLRHPSQPLYTPEPDLVHEVLGHGIMLGDPVFARLHRLTGEAARRLETDAALRFLARVFWFTCEFGVVREGNELVCYGAGLLSSYGEIGEFRTADVRPLDFHAMGTVDYDIGTYQPVLFGAESLTHLEDAVGSFLETMDDDTPARLAQHA